MIIFLRMLVTEHKKAKNMVSRMSNLGETSRNAR